MSIFGTMKTAVSGMNAQANRLGTVADNIANVNTTGYKAASTAFSSFVLASGGGGYNSGGVTSTTVYSVSQQGSPTATSSSTDLAISGDGFFVVQDASGTAYLTRVGNFTIDDSGYLVNSAGFTLLGSTTVGGSVNTFSDLEPIQIRAYELAAVPSTTATQTANLDLTADAVTDATLLPSANDPNAEYTLKSSMTTYNAAGTRVIYDVYYTKTNDNAWEVAVYDSAGATDGGFPYASGPVTTADLVFDSTTYSLATIDGSSDLKLDIDGITLDMSKTTQLDSASSSKLAANGSAPSSLDSISVDSAGIVYAVYESGSLAAIGQVPLATVISPDNLKLHTGNVYSITNSSGAAVFGYAGEPGFGTIISNALETSNVDLANELTEMIEAQRSYTANSKVFQTGADVLDVLINLKR